MPKPICSLVGLVVGFLWLGAAPSLAQNPKQQPNAGSANVQTISPASGASQNPYVNPDAAGTQLGGPSIASPNRPAEHADVHHAAGAERHH